MNNDLTERIKDDLSVYVRDPEWILSTLCELYQEECDCSKIDGDIESAMFYSRVRSVLFEAESKLSKLKRKK